MLLHQIANNITYVMRVMEFIRLQILFGRIYVCVQIFEFSSIYTEREILWWRRLVVMFATELSMARRNLFNSHSIFVYACVFFLFYILLLIW